MCGKDVTLSVGATCLVDGGFVDRCAGSMPHNIIASQTLASGNDEHTKSRFSYRDLKLLSHSSVNSPLRVITLIDFDCFYAQCEAVRLGIPPEAPLGVQQFKHVIAMNYAARARGLKKVSAADEVKRRCPEIVLQHVPTWREGDTTWRYRDDALEHMDIDKSSLDYYRLQSKKAMALLKATLPGDNQIVEKAGIDETYVDLSASVYAILLERFSELKAQSETSLDSFLPLPVDPSLDWQDSAVEEDTTDDAVPYIDWDDIALHIGCEIVQSIRSAIHRELRYTCSAGIARNKVLAKLAAGHNKPNRQTVIRNCGIPSFLSGYKFTKIRGLGRKLGREVTSAFGTEQVTDLLNISLPKMTAKLGSTGAWVYNVIRGNETSEVTTRTQLKSVLSAKTFMQSLQDISQAEKWLFIFASDIIGRLDDLGGRRPKTIAVHLQVNGPMAPTRSKQGPIPLGAKLDIDCLLGLSRGLLAALEREASPWPLVTLSVSVSDLQDVEKGTQSISSLLAAQRQGTSKLVPEAILETHNSTSRTSSIPRKRTLLDFRGFVGRNDVGSPASSALDASKRPRVADDSATSAAETPLTANGHSLPNGTGTDRAEDDSEGTYECPTCGRRVSAADVLEHLDWHAAIELSENG